MKDAICMIAGIVLGIIGVWAFFFSLIPIYYYLGRWYLFWFGAH